MHKLHIAHPTVMANTWVDDIAQTMVGPFDAVVHGAVNASTQLVRGLEQLGLTISPKSQFVASNMQAAKDIQAALRRNGIDVQVGQVGLDLGVDFVAGAKRRVSNQTTRMVKVRSGVASTLKLGSVTKGAATRRLILTGVKPRVYGFSALGAAPTTIASIRTSIVKGLCIRKPGGCATTALLMHNFHQKDPLLTMTVDNVVAMVEAIIQQAGPTLVHKQTFVELVANMPADHRWSKVCGPMSSGIATLLDMGWTLHGIDKWQDPEGVVWQLDFSDPMAVDVVKEILNSHVYRHIWGKFASKHFAGLSEQPDLTAYRSLKKSWQKVAKQSVGKPSAEQPSVGKPSADCSTAKVQKELATRSLYFLDTVVQGAAKDFAEKAFHVNEEGLPACTLCKQVCTTCPYEHVAYYCQTVEELDLEGVAASRHLVQQARDELRTKGNDRKAFWLRGICPLPELPDPLSCEYKFHSSFQHLDVNGKILGGDGSGGRLSKDFRTRRCGFGLAIISFTGEHGSLHFKKSQFQLVGYASGSVPGKQSVPRAEATALLHALQTTSGNAVFVCDNLGVVRRYKHYQSKKQHQSKKQPAENGQLWNQIAKASKERSSSGRGVLEVVWVPSHLTFEAATNRGYSPLFWLVNQLADKLAGGAAERHQISGLACKTLEESMSLACMVLRRLVDVLTHLADTINLKDARALSVKEATVSKEELISGLAKQSGHALDSKFKCVKCQLQLNMSRSIAFHESTLHMKCLGGKVLPNTILHSKSGKDHAEDFQHYLFHKLAVHKTHTMATHGPLQLRYCTYCGAYGRHKSCHLKQPCPLIPTKGGKQALAMLIRDLDPGEREVGIRHHRNAKCSLAKLSRAKLAYHRHKSKDIRAKASGNLRQRTKVLVSSPFA
jgi:ribonuclease HI